MKRLKNYTFGFAVLVAAILGGCSDEEVYSAPKETPSPEVVLQIKSPQMDDPQSRAMSRDDEEAVKSLKVLVFSKNPSSVDEQQEQFQYVATVLEQKANTPSAGITQIRVKLTTTDTPSRLVLIANHPDQSQFATIQRGMTKEQAYQTLVTDFTTKWDATAGSASIPMWGESNLTTVTNDPNRTKFADYTVASPTTTLPIKMLRALARVDVGVAFADDVKSEDINSGKASQVPFMLKEVHVYRNYNKFRTAGRQNATGVLTPNGAQAMDDAHPASYTLPTASKSFVREIYIPERPNKGASFNHGNVGCIVIGGYYNGSNTVTYYRADFVEAATNGTDATEYMDIRRNFRYRFNITKVSGAGFDTKEDALKSRSFNVQYTITPWDDTALNDIVTDGQYMLGISRDVVEFYREGDTQELTVRTDWPQGWTIKKLEGGDGWLTFNPTSGVAYTAGRADSKVSFKTTENTTGAERLARFEVSAGRMKRIVTVKQHPYTHIDIGIFKEDGTTPLSLAQFTGDGGKQKIVVKYVPASATLTGPTVILGNHFTYNVVEEKPGQKTYEITANPMTDENTPFESFTDQWRFTAKIGNQMAQADMYLLQNESNAIPFEDRELNISLLDNKGQFIMDGIEKKIYIKANTPYTLTLVKNTSDEPGASSSLKLIESGLPVSNDGDTAGEEIKFMPANDLTDLKRIWGYATFKLTSPTNAFREKEFKVLMVSGKEQPEANSYLMKPSKVGVMIPVTQINRAKKHYEDFREAFETTHDFDEIELPSIDDNTAWEPELVWAETKKAYGTRLPIQENGTGLLRMVKKIGSGKDGYILVVPGNSETGNAVVALKSNGTILWSWHLWIVESYPSDMAAYGRRDHSNMRTMDRDLGAMKACGSLAGAAKKDKMEYHGMLYQWGRKDPFVPLNEAKGNRQVLNSYGITLSYGTVGKEQTMKYSIQNPTTLINVKGIRANWILEGGAQDGAQYLWGAAPIRYTAREGVSKATAKTPFDPCPYGWRVPNCGTESDWVRTNNLTAGTYYQKGTTATWYPNDAIKLVSNAFPQTDTAAGTVVINASSRNVKDFASYGKSQLYPIRPVRNTAQDGEADYEKYLPN